MLRELRRCLHLDCLTVDGETLGERSARRRLGRPRRDPPLRRADRPAGGLVALFGIAGARWRHPQALGGGRPSCSSARAARWCSRRSRISPARIDDPALDVDAGRFPGAARTPGRAAAGHARGGLPADPEEAGAGRRQGHGAHLRCAHERHRVRHRWCSTSRPRRPSGGPLALVRNGDRIGLSVKDRRIDLLVDPKRVAAAPRNWRAPELPDTRLRPPLRRQHPAGRPRLRLRFSARLASAAETELRRGPVNV